MTDRKSARSRLFFCAVYAEEMTCYIPAAERTYTYPKTTFTRRYEHERITLHTCRRTAEADGAGHFGDHPGEGRLQESSHLCLPNWFLHHQQGRSPKLDRLNAAKKELEKTTGEKPVTQKMFQAI